MLVKLSKVKELPFPAGYVAATLLLVMAAAMTSVFWHIIDRPISSPLFLAAIVLSSWICGVRVGIYTSLVAGFAIDFLYLEPYYKFSATPEEQIRLALFFGEGSLLSWLVDKLRLASERIRRSHNELRELTKYEQTLRESEQKRIALELHDELGQALTGLKMDAHFLIEKIAVMRSDGDRTEAIADLKGLSKRIDNTLVSVRRITSELRPSILDDFGLVAASEWQIKEFQNTTNIRCDFESNVDELDLGSDSNTAVFRILQEALTNVARHAAATSVAIRLNRLSDGLTMTIVDNGKGIGIDNQIGIHTLGLLGMRERTRLIGGQLEIQESPGGGTAVKLSVPIDGTIAVAQ